MSRHTPLAEWDARRQRTTQRNDITGLRSGKLVAREPVAVSRFRNVMWRCDCDCGGSCIANGSAIKRGAIQGCGCGRAKSLPKARAARWKKSA